MDHSEFGATKKILRKFSCEAKVGVSGSTQLQEDLKIRVRRKFNKKRAQVNDAVKREVRGESIRAVVCRVVWWL